MWGGISKKKKKFLTLSCRLILLSLPPFFFFFIFKILLPFLEVFGAPALSPLRQGLNADAEGKRSATQEAARRKNFCGLVGDRKKFTEGGLLITLLSLLACCSACISRLGV